MNETQAGGASSERHARPDRREHSDPVSICCETVRAACLHAAMDAYEDAGIRGLCADGRWEAALAAIRQLDLSGVHAPLRTYGAPDASVPSNSTIGVAVEGDGSAS
jgi:hypothetical protein